MMCFFFGIGPLQATHYTPHHPTVDEWFCERLSEDENLLLISLSLAVSSKGGLII
jgi:hypothetical protein